MPRSVHIIDAFRKISASGEDTLSGSGLIKALRKLQNPEFQDYKADRDKFERILAFVKSVLGEAHARLEIPAEKDDVYVVINDKTLPLASLGTGIHELVILAAAVTMLDNAIVCIEEPEIHCHPELQKKFSRYLLDNTGNQYLIASHSNAFLDLNGANTYRCWLNQAGYTECELASSVSEKHALLRDLGYKPSDLLQANFVVWVEGPSDRVYINHWLTAKAPDLVEGLHYAVMFYGGRLLSHLCYDSPDDHAQNIEDFVRLARLNRNACIVIDSDRNEVDQCLNQTKLRIQAEFERNSCLVWITEGRTIENYLPEQLRNDVVASVHPQTKEAITWGRFLDMTKISGGRAIDKVAVARRVAESPADFSQLNLDVAIDGLVQRIRDHNS